MSLRLIFLLLLWCFFGVDVDVAGFISISSSPSSSSSRNNFYPSPPPSLAAQSTVVDTTTTITESTTQQPAAASAAFQHLIQKAVQTILKSDTDGDELEHSYGSASQGLWLHSKSAREMQSLLDRIVLQVRSSYGSRGSSAPLLLEEKTDDSDDSTTEAKRKTYDNNNNNNNDDEEEEDAFESLVRESFQTMIQSDVHRPDGSSSQGRWVYDPAARKLQAVLDRLVIYLPDDITNSNETISSSQMLLDNEQRAQWIKWMKSTPNPLFLDLTSHIRQLVEQNYCNEGTTGSGDEEDRWITKEHLQSVDMTLEEYTSRIACHVILLPSGAETAPLSLVESTGAHVYGKLLYGGVTRFRLLKSGKTVRRAGENREVMMTPPSSSSKHNKSHPSWVQLGGIERRYEAVDMGPAAVLEITLLPKLWQDLPTVFDKSTIMGDKRGDMTISDAAFGWDPSKMLKLLPESQDSESSNDDKSMQESRSSSEDGIFGAYEGEQRNVALRSHFQSRVGGLQSSIDAIVRRVLDGRSIYAQSIHNEGDSDAIKKAQSEAEELALLGITPVRGLLLYGKPGVGKTLIVREIARALGARPPKIVAASELLDRWVGGSERLVRELFQEAEEELKHWQTVARSDEKDIAHLKSSLHVIVVDEIDAVFRSRTDSEDSGAITRNSVVNQLLAKLDGVRALPNVLLIAMTNRRELLDPAILRPGRLEVQIEIAMPDKEARREILQIHFSALRKRNRLSYLLRCAIDGVNAGNSLAEERTQSDGTQHANSDKSTRNQMRKRDRLKTSAKKLIGQLGVSRNSSIDIADDKYTGGMSGADIAGLVRNAGSLALARARKDGSGVEGLLVTLEDVISALEER